MMAKIILLASLLLAANVFAAYWTAAAFLSPKLVLEGGKELAGANHIEARAWPEGNAFHLGDAISYFVEIKYNRQIVKEIDKNRISESVDLGPFRVISKKESELTARSRTGVYLIEYEIQLIEGSVGRQYFFPIIYAPYKTGGSDWQTSQIYLQPVFISPRFPSDTAGFELKSSTARAVNNYARYLPWIFVGLGIVWGAWSGFKMLRIIYNRRKRISSGQKGLEGVEDIFSSYRGLLKKSGEPKFALHQAQQVLRTLLTRKEGIDWTLPDWKLLPEAIRRSAANVLNLSQKAYGSEILRQEELDEALAGLGEIFSFYLRKEEAR